MCGDTFACGFEADDLARCSWHAYGSAGIGAVCGANGAVGHHNCGASRRATWGAAGVGRRLEHGNVRALCVAGRAQLRGQRLAVDGDALRQKIGDKRIGCCCGVGACRAAVGSGHASNVGAVFDRNLPTSQTSNVWARPRVCAWGQRERGMQHGASVGASRAGRLVGTPNREKVGFSP